MRNMADAAFGGKHESKSEFRYTNRFVSFLDILGWKSTIFDSIHDDKSLEKVARVVDLFREVEKDYLPSHWRSEFLFMIKDHIKVAHEENIDVEMSLFSDSIIVSYGVQETTRFVDWYRQFSQVLNDLCRLQFHFAAEGVFFRGGLSYGGLYHDGNICFGPSLIKAVNLEGKVARYPCIAVDDDIAGRITRDLRSDEIDDYAAVYKMPLELKNCARDLCLMYLNRQVDEKDSGVHGAVFIDYLLSAFKKNPNNVERVKPAIEKAIMETTDPDVLRKYMWLRDYFNDTLNFRSGYDRFCITI